MLIKTPLTLFQETVYELTHPGLPFFNIDIELNAAHQLIFRSPRPIFSVSF